MRILVVDDDPGSCKALTSFLSEAGHDLMSASSGMAALECLKKQPCDLMLSDYRMPGMNGLELMKAAEEIPHCRHMDTVIITAYAEIDVAVSAIKSGAFDYLSKPLRLQELAIVVQKVEQHQQLQQKYDLLNTHFEEEVAAAVNGTVQQLDAWKRVNYQIAGLASIQVCSPAMRRVMEQAEILHRNRFMPVLLEGETGTGKELVARFIHYGPLEEAQALPFIALNCANLSESLFESELFGYEAGAFTGGAARGQIGKVDLAHGGSLFLDEINSLPNTSQAKILRLLEDKRYYRLGGQRDRQADIRIIAASNRDLQQLILAGNFRDDLFYRLAAARLRIPPLRERLEDILPLACHFLSEARGLPVTESALVRRCFPPATQKLLLEYHWPGNIRQLRNVIFYASMLNTEDELSPRDLGPLLTDRQRQEDQIRPVYQQSDSTICFPVPEGDFDLNSYMNDCTHELMRSIIMAALQRNGGHKNRTAEQLRISRHALYRRLSELGLE